MSSLFYALGKQFGRKMGEAYWTGVALTGTGAKAIEAEYLIGRQLASSFQEQLLADAEMDTLLQETGARLTEELANRRDWRFTFRLLDTPETNAFALMGGFVFVTKPLLTLCEENQEELAFVLGHEIGHVIKRHPVDKYKANMALQMAISRVAPGGGPIAQSVTGKVVQLLQQTYSQDKELEADKFAVRIAHQAGFDPTAGLRLLDRFTTLSAPASPLDAYFASHPPLEQRKNRIERVLK